ncbi:MAG: hypothetical protein ACP5RC_05120, partial [Halothiobacillaceae bacterium]
RVVFDTRNQRFTIYADNRLRTATFLRRVRRAFGLDSARYAVRPDLHYRSSLDLQLRQDRKQ